MRGTRKRGKCKAMDMAKVKAATRLTLSIITATSTCPACTLETRTRTPNSTATRSTPKTVQPRSPTVKASWSTSTLRASTCASSSRRRTPTSLYHPSALPMWTKSLWLCIGTWKAGSVLKVWFQGPKSRTNALKTQKSRKKMLIPDFRSGIRAKTATSPNIAARNSGTNTKTKKPKIKKPKSWKTKHRTATPARRKASTTTSWTAAWIKVLATWAVHRCAVGPAQVAKNRGPTIRPISSLLSTLRALETLARSLARAEMTWCTNCMSSRGGAIAEPAGGWVGGSPN